MAAMTAWLRSGAHATCLVFTFIIFFRHFYPRSCGKGTFVYFIRPQLLFSPFLDLPTHCWDICVGVDQMVPWRFGVRVTCVRVGVGTGWMDSRATEINYAWRWCIWYSLSDSFLVPLLFSFHVGVAVWE
jgi:hypothetical protein